MENNAPHTLILENGSNQNAADPMLCLWTAQTEAVLDSIREKGFSQVKTEYIDKKYGETAWIFKEAYGFFKQKAGLIVPLPEGAQSPIWQPGGSCLAAETGGHCQSGWRIYENII